MSLCKCKNCLVEVTGPIDISNCQADILNQYLKTHLLFKKGLDPSQILSVYSVCLYIVVDILVVVVLQTCLH